MSSILCLYCTRTGHTESLMRSIAEKVDGELVEITDGKDRRGALGYIGAAIAGLRKSLPELREFRTERPLEEYDKVILGMPIWSENTCPIARSFLAKYGSRIKGDVYYVVTHGSEMPYDRPIAQLDKILGKPHKLHLSVSSRRDDLDRQAEAFANQLK